MASALGPGKGENNSLSRISFGFYFPTMQFLDGLLYVGPGDSLSIPEADLQPLAVSKIHAHPPPHPHPPPWSLCPMPRKVRKI